MTMSEKIKPINNKIEQSKAQYHLDRQTAKISLLLSGNVSKYEFLTSKDVLPVKYLLQKAVKMKRFEYSLLGKELKSQTDIAKKQYQKLDDTFKFDKIIKKEESTFKKCNKSNLIYNSKHSFKSKFSFPHEFLKDLSKFKKLKTIKQETEKKKTNVHDISSELYNELLGTYYD